MFKKLKQYFRRSSLKSIEQLPDETEKWRNEAIMYYRSAVEDRRRCIALARQVEAERAWKEYYKALAERGEGYE